MRAGDTQRDAQSTVSRASPWYFLLLAILTAATDDTKSAIDWLEFGMKDYPHETNLNRFMGHLLILYHSDFPTAVTHFHHALRTTLANLHEIETSKSPLLQNDIYAQLNSRYTKAKHRIIRELAYYVALSPVPLPGDDTLVSQKDVEEWLKPRFPELLKNTELCLGSASANLMRHTLLSMEDARRYQYKVAAALMGRNGNGDSASKEVQSWIASAENKRKVNKWLSYYTADLFKDYQEPPSALAPTQGNADCLRGQYMKGEDRLLLMDPLLGNDSRILEKQWQTEDRNLLMDLFGILRAGVRQELVRRAGLKEAERLMYSISSPFCTETAQTGEKPPASMDWCYWFEMANTNALNVEKRSTQL